MLGLAGFAIFLLVILSIVSLVASIWLIVVAFRKSLLWGLAVIFLPFAALVFAVMHWQEAKKPFLIGLAASVAAIAVVLSTVGVGAAAMSKQMADQMSKEMAKEMAKAAAEGRVQATPAAIRTVQETEAEAPNLTSSDLELPSSPVSSATARMPSLPSPRAGSKKDALEFDGADITSDGYAEVPFRDAKRAVGRQVRIVARNGEVHEGDLVSATQSGVEIEHAFRSGTISVEYGKAEIGKLLVKVLP